jgi:hypothetical protein
MVLDFAGINQKASYGYSAYGSPVSSLTKTSGFSINVNAYRYTGKRLDTMADESYSVSLSVSV